MMKTSQTSEQKDRWVIDFWLPGEDAPLHFCKFWALDEADAVAQCLALYGEQVESIHMVMTEKDYEEMNLIMELEMLYSFSGFLEEHETTRTLGKQD